MLIPQGALKIDSPAWPVLQAKISYWGLTTAAGNALGTTLICAGLANEPNYSGHTVKILSGGAAGQVRQAIHAGNTITVANPWTNAAGAAQQIAANTRFTVLSDIGGGGVAPGPPPPSVGLWMFGVVDPGMAVGSLNTFACPNLAGLPEDIFNDEFWCQVIHNADAPQTAPEREIRHITNYVSATGTFTVDDFSANIEANDIIAVFHESIMSIEIMGFGTLTTSSATVPADANRVGTYPWENNDYFKGCVLIPTEGNCRFQPRPIRSYLSATGVFTLDEPFSQAPGLVDYVIARAAYPVQRLLDIFNLVNAMLVTTETGGTIATTGAVQDVYINNAPGGVYEPLVVKLDFTNMTAAETIVVSVYYRIRPGGGLVLQDQNTYVGVQNPPLIPVRLDPNRYGVQVTLQCTAGGPINVDWEVVYRV